MSEEQIIQVQFHGVGRRFAYRYCGPPVHIGDTVKAPTIYGEDSVATVVAFGRTSYSGPLKLATREDT